MGLFEFLVFVILVMVIGWFGIWIASKLAPGHPPIIDNIIWVLVVVIIVMTLAGVLGVHDVQIPRLFR